MSSENACTTSGTHVEGCNSQPIPCICRCIWKDASNSWQAFLDVCPHRLIPLSEGRITDAKELQCAYHGWCFEASGKCTAIPQGGNASNPRTWATVYQCTVKQGQHKCHWCRHAVCHAALLLLLLDSSLPSQVGSHRGYTSFEQTVHSKTALRQQSANTGHAFSMHCMLCRLDLGETK